MDAPAPRRSKRPAGLANLNTRSLDVANSFTLTETGTFQKGGFSIKATGIKQAPSLQHGDFSSLTLEQLEPLDYLGQGASGTVRLARHRESGHLLALKVINVLSDQGQRHQALNELKVLTSLHHPQLVPLFDAFYLEGNVFLALGYMNGGSLEQLLGSYTPLALAAGLEPRGLPEGVLSGLLLQMLCGLSYLHSMGVVHRDLKPANVLIDTTGHARLSDFGISKEMAATFVSSFVGTAAYMAPERINGAEYAMESDIWALGMVAIECALGAHPFQHVPSYYDLVVQLSDGAAPPRLPPDAFSDGACRFIACSLDTSPECRPSAAELLRHDFFLLPLVDGNGLPPDDSAVCAELAAAQIGAWVRATFPHVEAPNVAGAGGGGASAADPDAHCDGGGYVEHDAAGAAGADALHGAAHAGEYADESLVEEMSAVRIQAWLRGAVVRRDLEEMRLLQDDFASARMED